MNMECSIADRVRASALEAVSNGAEWPVGELFDFCQKRNPEEKLNRNTFYSIMSRMERKYPPPGQEEKGGISVPFIGGALPGGSAFAAHSAGAKARPSDGIDGGGGHWRLAGGGPTGCAGAKAAGLRDEHR